MFNLFRPTVRELPGNNEFRIIGARNSGKTTYLAALAYWPNARLDSPIESVDPLDDETEKLINLAQDILENGMPLAGSYIVDDPDDLPSYSLSIRLKSRFGNQNFNISCKDYPGEVFSQLRGGDRQEIVGPYLDDCAEAPGLLLMIDGKGKIEDRNYSQALEIMKKELNLRLTALDQILKNYRIAIVFSKAEQSQVWLYRNKLNEFVDQKFPEVQKTMQKWSREWQCSIKYFNCSAFGMKGNPPRPNVRMMQGGGAVIDRPKFWRPFGLIAPIYWLYTGKEDSKLI